jgi:hypothetical protein
MITFIIKAQYQYHASGLSIENSIRMRFDLKGNIGDIILSQNDRVAPEGACVPPITDMIVRLVIVCLASSTQDKVFDLKNQLIEIPFHFV